MIQFSWRCNEVLIWWEVKREREKKEDDIMNKKIGVGKEEGGG